MLLLWDASYKYQYQYEADRTNDPVREYTNCSLTWKHQKWNGRIATFKQKMLVIISNYRNG